jgi:hypothetical protein
MTTVYVQPAAGGIYIYIYIGDCGRGAESGIWI